MSNLELLSCFSFVPGVLNNFKNGKAATVAVSEALFAVLKLSGFFFFFVIWIWVIALSGCYSAKDRA